jgi:hypothetical protein
MGSSGLIPPSGNPLLEELIVIPTAESSVNDGERPDVHDVAADEPAAAAGRCGAIHLPTGRICRAAARHVDGRDFGPVA